MAQGGLKAWAAMLALLAAACAAPPAPKPQPPPPKPPPPVVQPPPPAPRPSAPPPMASVAPRPDSCGANALQYLVGKPHTDIPPPVQPSRRRVICSTCVMSEGYVPYRQTIIYDSASGLVTEVHCG